MSVTKEGTDIVVRGFEAGIADSPYAGINDMRNIDIISIPGEASVGFATIKASQTPSTGSVISADAGADTITVTVSTGSLSNAQAIVFAGGSLPGNVVAGTTYWIFNLAGGDTFQIAAAPQSSTPINISGTGTGTYATVDMGKPTYSAFDSTNGATYVIDTNGRVWKGLTTTTWVFMGNTTLTNANGNGIAFYRSTNATGYIFAFRNALIDYMPIASPGTWTYGWQSMNTAAGTNNPHQTIFAQDNAIYYTDGIYVGSFFEKALQQFNPATASTYTFGQKALGLPTFETAQCLEELGINLLVGGIRNLIYPWDRTSTSFNIPIKIPENFVSKMVTVNTSTYIFAGNRGRIYITNGTQAKMFKKVPDHLSGTVEPYFTWGGVGYSRNQLYFGVQATTNGGAANNNYGGLWAIDTETSAIRLINQLSYGTYAGIASVVTPTTLTTGVTNGSGLFIGWDSGASTYGIDVSSGDPYTGGQAYVDSDLIPIGTFLKPTSNLQVEFKLNRPMVTGESILLQYRQTFNASYTSIGSAFTLANTTNGYSGVTDGVPFQNSQWIQIRAVLTSTATTPTYTRLTELRLR